MGEMVLSCFSDQSVRTRIQTGPMPVGRTICPVLFPVQVMNRENRGFRADQLLGLKRGMGPMVSDLVDFFRKQFFLRFVDRIVVGSPVSEHFLQAGVDLDFPMDQVLSGLCSLPG